VQQHFLGEVHRAVTGRFRTDQRATVAQTFTGQYAIRTVGNLFQHAVHKANFTTADTDIAGRYVGVRTDMTVQFGHKGLAEAHDFATALTFRIKIRTAFTTAHRQGGQGIFKGLFKRQELQHRLVHGRVETQTTFERANGRVVLNTVATVYVNIALIINPGYTELNDALRLYQTIQQTMLGIARMLGDERP